MKRPTLRWLPFLAATACVPPPAGPAPVGPGAVAGPTPSARPTPTDMQVAPARSSPFVDLQYGGSFCALREDGRVACWGENASSSLGDGTNEARSHPVFVPGLDHVRRLLGLPSMGFCALRTDASLWCWGFANTGDTSMPTTGVTARLVAERVHDFGFAARFPGVCARHEDGRTTCVELRPTRINDCAYWADDAHSSCLFNMYAIRQRPRPFGEAGRVRFGQAPVPMPGHETCFLEGGAVLCEGPSNLEGELGDPALARADVPTRVPGLRDVVSLSDWGIASCAVRADGVALCWGRNLDRELVVAPDPVPCPSVTPKGETCNRRPSPLPIANVAQVLLTGERTFVLTRDGAIRLACRKGTPHPCALGTMEPIAGIPPAAKIVAGRAHSPSACALTKAGDVYCYGHGTEIGDGLPLVSRRPVPIPGIRGAVEVEANLTSACALRADGTVTCWGDLGAPRGLRDIVALGNPCALAKDGRVWCWGSNVNGEMGLGRRERPGVSKNPDIEHDPLPVPGLRNVQSVSSTNGTTCALDRSGTVRCWGPWGPKFPTLSPTTIPGLPSAREIWSAESGPCALDGNGSVWCFNRSEGAATIRRPDLGAVGHLPSHGRGASPTFACVVDPSDEIRCSGIAAPRLSSIKHLSVSHEDVTLIPRACALHKDGALDCWGPSHCAGTSILCTGGTWSRTERLLDQVRQVSVGMFLTCAVRTDGTVWCWGQTYEGGLGGPYPPPDRVGRVALEHVGQ